MPQFGKMQHGSENSTEVRSQQIGPEDLACTRPMTAAPLEIPEFPTLPMDDDRDGRTIKKHGQGAGCGPVRDRAPLQVR